MSADTRNATQATASKNNISKHRPESDQGSRRLWLTQHPCSFQPIILSFPFFRLIQGTWKLNLEPWLPPLGLAIVRLGMYSNEWML